jgi:hypothetical protein
VREDTTPLEKRERETLENLKGKDSLKGKENLKGKDSLKGAMKCNVVEAGSPVAAFMHHKQTKN